MLLHCENFGLQAVLSEHEGKETRELRRTGLESAGT
jgi:hypothetical protein